MATKTYGTTAIPSDIVTVRSGSTVSISLGFNATLGIVGNMDVANGSSTPGTVESVGDVSDAIDLFGDGSELHRAVSLAFENDTPEIFAVGVPETEQTESFTSASTGTLSNLPVADPNVAQEHSVDIQDVTAGSSMETNLVYGTSSPSTPSDPEVINVNPITGDWAADSSSDYDFTYNQTDFGDAIRDISDKNLRYLCALTESESVANTVLTELNSHAQNFDFMRGVVGGTPETMPTDYTDALDDQRMVVVEPPRAYLDTNQSDMVRSMASVAGHLTSRPFAESATGSMHGQIDGLVRLNEEFTVSEISDYHDKQILTLRHGTNIHITKDLTTSSDGRFERVYSTEISDEVALLSHLVAEQYVGSLNFADQRKGLELSLESPVEDMATDRPPLLENYVINVSEGATDFEVDVEIGIDIVGVMDQINVNITVGDVTTFDGTA